MATVNAITKIILERTRVPLEYIEIDTEDPTSYTIIVNDALSRSLMLLGFAVANIISVQDSDVSPLSALDLKDLLDLSEYRILVTCVNNMDTTDERLGPHGKWESQYPERLRKRIEHLEKENTFLFSNKDDLQLGVITLDFLYD